MLRVTSDDVEKLYKALKDLDGERGLPYAVQRSLNTSAFAAMKEWEKQGRKSMNVRNKWTFKRSFHRVNMARKRKSITQMQSVTGNKHPYMNLQEKGFTKHRAKGLQIPEMRARRMMSQKRLVSPAHFRKPGKKSGMKLPKKRYHYRESRFHQRARSLWTRRQGRVARAIGHGYPNAKKRYVAASLRQARAEGATHMFLDWGGGNKGFHDIRKKRVDLEHSRVWNQSRKMTRTKRNPMLRRTLEELKPYFPQYHRMALERQIRFVLTKRKIPYQGPPGGLVAAAHLAAQQR